jgi:hypothetical protein
MISEKLKKQKSPSLNFTGKSAQSNRDYCGLCHGPILIPGLDGYRCGSCGWVGTCQQCGRFAGQFILTGICLNCDLANRQAALERKRRKSRKTKGAS